MKNYFSKPFIFLYLATALSCSEITLPTASEAQSSTPELSFCETSTEYSPGVIVSGTASFKKRRINVGSNYKLDSSTTSALPIRYAEIRVTLNNTLVQCGTTNASGELKALDGSSALRIPNEAGTYVIQVLSRAKKTMNAPGKPVSATLYTSVKEDIYSNSVYSISKNLNSNGFAGGPNPSVQLIAEADESLSPKVEGGAFNIYNNWVTVFDYLKDSSNTGSLDVSCLDSKVDVYWKAGFNPAQYVYPSYNPSSLPNISFYLHTEKELYINGGSLGNVTRSDTDHFDDTVILHEMGHHVENVCGTMDSPGGTHFALYRIDPRLAWSEGWGNFFGAHIVKNNIAQINPDLPASLPNNEWLHYHDTLGYGSTGESLILMRLNQSGDGSGGGTAYDTVFPNSYPGESHFREASIARGLFKGVNTCSTNCVNGVSFDKYWTALGKTSNGMGNPSNPFTSSDKFFSKVYSANSNTFSASMTTMLTQDEALHKMGHVSYETTAATSPAGTVNVTSWPGYGARLTTGLSCNRMLIQPRDTSQTYSDASDQRFSNHFYSFKKSELVGVTEIHLVPDSSCSADLDLIVFKSDYRYNEDCTEYGKFLFDNYCSRVVKTTSADIVGHSRSTGLSETVYLNPLANEYYMLNVRAYNAIPKYVESNLKCVYRLTDQNGSLLCPNTSY
ncbi:MAG: hypothetical protein ACK41T_03345 [Pseudobdellovibrio sp.]